MAMSSETPVCRCHRRAPYKRMSDEYNFWVLDCLTCEWRGMKAAVEAEYAEGVVDAYTMHRCHCGAEMVSYTDAGTYNTVTRHQYNMECKDE